jgi:hypothetical protein
MLAVRASKPVARVPLEAVMLPLRDQDVDVGVVLLPVVIVARVNGKRVRQTLAVRQRLDEVSRQVDLILGGDVSRQREIAADVQAPIRAFVQIRGVPVRAGIVRSPCH